MDFEKEKEIDTSLAPVGTPASSLIKEGNDLTMMIAGETDPNKLDDLTQLFNMNRKKREMVRVNRLSNLLELVDDEIMNRFTAYPDSFDHDQLLNYMRATTNAINNTTQSINQAPTIQINNTSTEVNFNSGMNLDRSSRERVMAAVSEILGSLQNNNGDDIIDVDMEGGDE